MGVRPGLGICRGLKGFDADAVEGVDEAFVGMAVCQIGADQALDRVGKLGGGKRPADHFADAGIVALAAAQRDLVPLLTVLVDAEDADRAEVVVAAGIHAAGDVEFQFADVVLVVEVIAAISAAKFPFGQNQLINPARSSPKA